MIDNGQYIYNDFQHPFLMTAKALAEAAADIEHVWQEQGYKATLQSYDVEGIPCSNLEVTHTGIKHPEQILLIGANTIPCPGARVRMTTGMAQPRYWRLPDPSSRPHKIDANQGHNS